MTWTREHKHGGHKGATGMVGPIRHILFSLSAISSSSRYELNVENPSHRGKKSMLSQCVEIVCVCVLVASCVSMCARVLRTNTSRHAIHVNTKRASPRSSASNSTFVDRGAGAGGQRRSGELSRGEVHPSFEHACFETWRCMCGRDVTDRMTEACAQKD